MNEKSFFEIDRSHFHGKYAELLQAVCGLSRLFSKKKNVPYLPYRAMENIFCRVFRAEDKSRSDTAFDAVYDCGSQKWGIGLKTFVCQKTSLGQEEKIAEFNELSKSKDWKNVSPELVVSDVITARNDRINTAKRMYGLQQSIYHIVARSEDKLMLFETDYDLIDKNFSAVKKRNAIIKFEDTKNCYSFNLSKSTLYRTFEIPKKCHLVETEIVEDPFGFLLDAYSKLHSNHPAKQYVVLPLYSKKHGEKYVPEKSGLNHWNAAGRPRMLDEVYISIPAKIHKKYPDFFPESDSPFKLKIPTGEIFEAKVCQDNRKALMTNPNSAIADWLLRTVLCLEEGEIATMEKLNALGFNSVIVWKVDKTNYRIDKSKISHSDFMLED